MGVKWEDRLEIKYQKVQGVIYPVIGTDISFGTPLRFEDIDDD